MRPDLACGSLRRLRAYVEAEGYKGYDPYDALKSPILRALTLGLKWPRIAVTQLMKRLPLNLRPLLLIEKGYNPKGLGLFLGGYARLYSLERRRPDLDRIESIMDRLEALRSPGHHGNSWGYDFPWQSRALYSPPHSPTIVNTSFIGHALLDTYEHTGSERALALALPAREFILRDLGRTGDGSGGICFSYTPTDDTAIHNANLLGASLLIRLHRHSPDAEGREAALRALGYSMRHQRQDGSWWYAERQMQHWVDSFHTGFNLEGIRHFIALGEADEYREAYARGVRFYADNFFLADGTPRYYHDRLHPIDIHCPAEAVAFFSGEGEVYRALTDRVLGWMIGHMQDARGGHFHFQRRVACKITIPYMRWSQAWAFRALTEYIYRRAIRC